MRTLRVVEPIELRQRGRIPQRRLKIRQLAKHCGALIPCHRVQHRTRFCAAAKILQHQREAAGLLVELRVITFRDAHIGQLRGNILIETHLKLVQAHESRHAKVALVIRWVLDEQARRSVVRAGIGVSQLGANHIGHDATDNRFQLDGLDAAATGYASIDE